jgi:hypothetical protein
MMTSDDVRRASDSDSVIADRTILCVTLSQFYPPRPRMQGMGKQRPGRKPQTLDINQLVAKITELARGATVGPVKEETGPAKDPAAVALGRKGGLKGGPARAARRKRRKYQHTSSPLPDLGSNQSRELDA